MSDTFKYLNQTGTGDEPAQEFLKKYADRYTPEQQARLEANGGPSVAGSAYAKYGRDPNAASTSTSTSTSTSSSSGGLKGSKSADEIRKEFGLIYDKNNAPQFDSTANKGRMQTNDGHMWYKDSAGQTQYLGQVAGEYERGNIGDGKDDTDVKRLGSDKSMFHKDYRDDPKGKKKTGGEQHRSTNAVLQQAHDETSHARGDFTNGFNSINDVANAMRHMISTESNAEPEKERTPIEYSPEIQQAQERVATYQNDIMSGKTTDDIFSNAESKVAPSFDATKGAAGIGTPKSGDSSQKATEATDSFLQNKKYDIKQKYNFQAQ